MAINGLILFYFLLYWRNRHRKRYGELLGLFFMIYAVNRFLIEFVRGDPIRGYYTILGLELSTSQWLGIPIFLVGLTIFLYARKKGLVVGKEVEYLSDPRSPFLKEKFKSGR